MLFFRPRIYFAAGRSFFSLMLPEDWRTRADKLHHHERQLEFIAIFLCFIATHFKSLFCIAGRNPETPAANSPLWPVSIKYYYKVTIPAAQECNAKGTVRCSKNDSNLNGPQGVHNNF
jgi:hypothetical protein